MRKFIFVTEVGAESGMGHYMRCYALAEEASLQGHTVIFCLAGKLPGGAITLPLKRNISTYTLSNLSEKNVWFIVQSFYDKSTWLILDSYRFDFELINKLSAEFRVLLFDDCCNFSHYHVAAVLNASSAAKEQAYREKGMRGSLLLGPNFTCIRSEFRNFSLDLHKQKLKRICVSIGGSDPQNLSLLLALDLLYTFSKYEVEIIIGPANLAYKMIKEAAKCNPRLILSFSPPKLSRHFATASAVVTAAGGTVGELCSLGVPAIVLVVVDNQSNALQSCPYPVLDARIGPPKNWMYQLTPLLNMTFQERRNMQQRLHKWVDGHGCKRVIETVISLGT